MKEESKLASFEKAVLPHLDAAYNLARWLVHNDQDAEDVVQESFMRAFKSFNGYYGGNSRAWLLTIVRNTCYTWLQKNRMLTLADPIDEKLDELGLDEAPPGDREELFSAWRSLFERVAERSVTTLVFEDLHWADAGLLDFIESILEWSRNSAIMVVTLAGFVISQVTRENTLVDL